MTQQRGKARAGAARPFVPPRAAAHQRGAARFALAALLLLAPPPPPARAQATPDSFGDAFPRNAPPMPVCNANRDGVAACLGGRQCTCGFERGGSVTGRRDGWRWDCGALRPFCGAPPADLPGRPEAAPPALFPQVTLPPPDGDAGYAPFRFR